MGRNEGCHTIAHAFSQPRRAMAASRTLNQLSDRNPLDDIPRDLFLLPVIEPRRSRTAVPGQYNDIDLYAGIALSGHCGLSFILEVTAF